jgi:hypothetical protein
MIYLWRNLRNDHAFLLSEQATVRRLAERLDVEDAIAAAPEARAILEAAGELPIRCGQWSIEHPHPVDVEHRIAA